EGGGPIDTLARATGRSGRDLYAYAAQLVGIAPGRVTPARKPSPRRSNGRDDPSRDIDVILAETVPIAGTIAEAYLRSRGVADPAVGELRFHPNLKHWESGTSYPALVAVIRDQEGERIAIHRTWLNADGTGKAPIEK